MLDINILKTRYFEIKLGNLTLDVEPPKVKVLKKVMAVTKTKNENTMEELAEVVGLILNKNKTKCTVTDDVIDELDLDQLNEILTAFFEWLGRTKDSKN